MKKLFYLLILAAFLVSINSHNTPFWNQLGTSIPSGSAYSSSANYGFQINWTDSVQGIGGVSSAIFESNFSESFLNYTKGTSPSVQNNTAGIYWINFTGIQAGNYIYKWYANDTSNNFNSTPYFIYKINDNPSPVYSNEQTLPPANPSYVANTSYLFNVSWSDSDLSYVNFESNHTGTRKNYTYPIVQNSSGIFWINLTDLKGRKFTYRWIAGDGGGGVNKTFERLYYIYKAVALFVQAPTFNIEEGNPVTVTCFSNSNQIDIGKFTLKRNGTTITHNSTPLSRFESIVLGVGSHVYECKTDGNENHTNQTIVRTINVVGEGETEEEPVRELKIIDMSSASIEVGKVGELEFNLSNTLLETLVDIDVTVTGIPATWYTVENVPSALLSDGNVKITVKFDIPSDADLEEYDLTIRVVTMVEDEEETKVVTENSTLTVTAVQETENEAATYYNSAYNKTDSGDIIFSLDWVDDRGLDSFIFSTNASGTWVNDSEVDLTGRTDTASVIKTISLNVGEMVSWKFYVKDSDGQWSESEEFYLEEEQLEGGGIDLITIGIIVALIVVVVAAYLILRSRVPQIEQKIEYYYRREDA